MLKLTAEELKVWTALYIALLSNPELSLFTAETVADQADRAYAQYNARDAFFDSAQYNARDAFLDSTLEGGREHG